LIAVDTNILVYAHRADSEWFDQASEAVRRLAEGAARWAIPWACVHEFFAIVTHARIYDPPSTSDQALTQLAMWLESPTLMLIGEEPGYFEVLSEVVHKARIQGPRVHDARIAAICAQHGVTELWSADRDFSRFGNLVVRNPLAAG
jgi:toxin-antitoxin system PIN domain toxin